MAPAAAAQSSQGSGGSDSGRGVPQDRAQAAAWYRKAAEQGDAKAQFNLGLMYRYGPGYSPGLERWVEVFDPAPGHARPATQGSPGASYVSGSGIPKDYVEAHKWMSLAAARATGENQKRFADARDSLAKVMTSEQIAEAQKRATEWTAAFEQGNQGPMTALTQDLRHVARTLLHSPVFSVSVVVILALGIGAAASIFSVVDALLPSASVRRERPRQAGGLFTRRAERRASGR